MRYQGDQEASRGEYRFLTAELTPTIPTILAHGSDDVYPMTLVATTTRRRRWSSRHAPIGLGVIRESEKYEACSSERATPSASGGPCRETLDRIDALRD